MRLNPCQSGNCRERRECYSNGRASLNCGETYAEKNWEPHKINVHPRPTDAHPSLILLRLLDHFLQYQPEPPIKSWAALPYYQLQIIFYLLINLGVPSLSLHLNSGWCFPVSLTYKTMHLSWGLYVGGLAYLGRHWYRNISRLRWDHNTSCCLTCR